MASADSLFCSHVNAVGKVRVSGIFSPEGFDSAKSNPGGVEDICRVCRGTSQRERPLFHPCQCTGSIKYIHQDCLVEWLKHSGKQVCELCQYKFQFAPIFRDDMPHALPVLDLITGIARSTLENMRHWMHLAFVSLMWLFFVPTCIYRIFKFLMYDSMWSIIKLPLEIFSLENILFDCAHGMLVVLISLLAFISIVWLRDQLTNGLGPNWLEEDRHEVNRVVMREAQEHVDLLRRHLEEAGARARQRHIVPDRVAVAAELTKLQDLLNFESTKLTDLLYNKYIVTLKDLWKKEMEIVFNLYGFPMAYKKLLKSARQKQHSTLQQFCGSIGNESFTDVDFGLSFEETVLLKLHDKPPQEFSDYEKENLLSELKNIRVHQQELIVGAGFYCNKLCTAMSCAHVDGGSGAANSWSELDDNLDADDVDDIEGKKSIHEIVKFKKEIKESAEKESAIIGRQHDEEVVRREVVEARMNRWYNRLLNRHQDDPLVLAHRQRRNLRRPNIGHAIAGLARDHNPMDGDEIGDNVDELTWARLLGLDGSFRFLEHVVWLICLNSVLILGFVYLPFQLGYFTATLLSFWTLSGIENWTGITSVFIGYCVISFIVLGFYYGTGKLNRPKLKSAMGITFISIKVGMILAVEAGVFPLMCGWWIDICSFNFFNSTLSLRQESMSRAPGTVMFLHWLAGMIFIFYLASFVMLLREVLRPGVLWFLRNLNDQNFHPINEMINLPFQRHIRRFLMSCVLFGVCVVMVLLLPSKIIPIFSVTFLPYKFSVTNTVSPIREIQIELILLQFVIPTLLEHGNCRAGFKNLMKKWAYLGAKTFGLESYLLDLPQSGGVLVDVHGSIIRTVPYSHTDKDSLYTGRLQVIGPGFPPFKPYLRPPKFFFRVAAFLLYTIFSTVVFSTFVLGLPVAIGRYALHLVGLVDAPVMYTASIGLYIIWIAIRLLTTLISHALQGMELFWRQVVLWMDVLVKCGFAGVIFFIIIPLFMGHLVELILLSPLRVPFDKLPVFYPSTEWALGLLHTKCMFGLIWLTDISFKHTLDTVYQAGIWNINLTFICSKVAWPVISILSLIMALPYVFFVGILRLSGVLSYRNAIIVYRYFFPSSLLLILVIGLALVCYLQCKKLYNHIRNEKYLIGRQLVNFKQIQRSQ